MLWMPDRSPSPLQLSRSVSRQSCDKRQRLWIPAVAGTTGQEREDPKMVVYKERRTKTATSKTREAVSESAFNFG